MKPELDFVKDQEGAVTVDWVVLTGAVIGLTLSAIAALSPAMQNQGETLLDPVEISTSF